VEVFDDAPDLLVAGKVYTVDDGRFVWCGGTRSKRRYTDFQDLVRALRVCQAHRIQRRSLMKYTAVFKSNPTLPVFYETFPCRSLQSAKWYAQARAKRYGWELVGVVME
jgi:hypothetical protein